MNELAGIGPSSAAKHRWRIWAALVAAGACVICASLAVAHYEHQRANSLLARSLGAERVETPPPAASAPSDFVLKLRPPVPSANVIRELERASASSGVSISEVTISPRPPAADSLGSDEFSLRLRGEYPAIKSVLIDLTGRFPSATVRSLRLRRDVSAGVMDATVLLIVWSRPTIDSGLGR